MVFSIIQKSQLEGALRMDAEYYQQEFLDLNLKLKNQKSKLLREIGEVVYGTTPPGGIFEKTGIPFIRSQDFSDLIVDTSDLVFCSEKFHNQNKKSRIKPGDILFAAVGATIGEMAIVQDEIKSGNINQNIAKVRIIDKNVNSYFVGLFFASKPGQLQIEKFITGNAQPYLNSEQIGSFVVPILEIKKQNEIGKYFEEIESKIEDSKNFYSQAENLLLEELGIADFKEENELFSIVNFSDVKFVQRMDAEYFQPKYENLMAKVKKQNIKILEDFVKEYSTGFPFKSENYQEQGIPLLRINNIKKGVLDLNDTAYLSEKDCKISLKDEAKSGDIVLSMSGTIGVSAIIPDDILKSYVNQRILKFTSKDINRDYLVLLLNSIVGLYQLERIGTGGVQINISYKDIKNILIPILPEKTQQKIADLVRQSHEARKKAKELLEEAKRKVEELIEK